MVNPKRSHVNDLDVGHSWLNEKPGSIQIKSHVRKRERVLISSYTRLTLAFAQVCCELRHGMVYCLFSEPPAPSPTNESPDVFEAYSLRVREPALIFVPEHWTAQRQAEWKAMEPSRQLQLCWAPHGLVTRETIVLPFSATVHPTISAKLARLEYHSKTNALLLLFMTGKAAYLGETNEIQNHCELEERHSSNGKLLSSNFVATQGWDAFPQWKYDSVKEVIEKFNQLCQDRDDLLTQYGSLEQRIQAAYPAVMLAVRRTESLLSGTTKQVPPQKSLTSSAQAMLDTDIAFPPTTPQLCSGTTSIDTINERAEEVATNIMQSMEVNVASTKASMLFTSMIAAKESAKATFQVSSRVAGDDSGMNAAREAAQATLSAIFKAHGIDCKVSWLEKSLRK